MTDIMGPDGVLNRFPDGMDDAAITAVMQRHYGAPKSDELSPVADWTPAAVEAQGPSGRIDPQLAADIAGQTIGTAGGIALGTPGGPAGQAAGGAAGNWLGKKAARYLMGADQPETGEQILDAATGAAGPLLGPLARGTARAATGLSRAGINQVEREAGETAKTIAARRAGVGADAEMNFRLDAIGKTLKTATEVDMYHAVDAAIKSATEGAISRAGSSKAGDILARSPADIAGGMVLQHLFQFVEPITGTLLGAGVTDAVMRKAIPALLNSPVGPRFAYWALHVDKSGSTRNAIANSLLGMSANLAINSDARTAIQSIVDDIAPKGEDAAPDRTKDFSRPVRPTPERRTEAPSQGMDSRAVGVDPDRRRRGGPDYSEASDSELKELLRAAGQPSDKAALREEMQRRQAKASRVPDTEMPADRKLLRDRIPETDEPAKPFQSRVPTLSDEEVEVDDAAEAVRRRLERMQQPRGADGRFKSGNRRFGPNARVTERDMFPDIG